MELASGKRAADWPEIRRRIDAGDRQAWEEAIALLDARLRQRYLNPIEALEHADSRPDENKEDDQDAAKLVVPGFAIVLLAVTVLETLYNFRIGPKPAPQQGTQCTFCVGTGGTCIKDSLEEPVHGPSAALKYMLTHGPFEGTFTKTLAGSFAENVRNGLAHQTETRGWKIWRDEPPGTMLGKDDDDNQNVLNRTVFIGVVKTCLNDYLKELSTTDVQPLKDNFLSGMDRLAATGKPRR